MAVQPCVDIQTCWNWYYIIVSQPPFLLPRIVVTVGMFRAMSMCLNFVQSFYAIYFREYKYVAYVNTVASPMCCLCVGLSYRKGLVALRKDRTAEAMCTSPLDVTVALAQSSPLR